MARKIAVRVTANFERNLESIQQFLEQNNIAHAYAELLDHLFDIALPNLENFPEMGRDFFARQPLTLDALAIEQKLRVRLGDASLREYIFGDYLVLYALRGAHLYALAIRHHRQLSFDLVGFWR